MPDTCLVYVDADLAEWDNQSQNWTWLDWDDWEWEITDCSGHNQSGGSSVTITGDLNNGTWGEMDWYDIPEATVGDSRAIDIRSDGLDLYEFYWLEVMIEDEGGNNIQTMNFNWTAYSDNSTESFNVTMPDTCVVYVFADLFEWDNQSQNWTHLDWEDWEWEITDCSGHNQSGVEEVDVYGNLSNGSWAVLDDVWDLTTTVGDELDLTFALSNLHINDTYTLEYSVMDRNSQQFSNGSWTWTANAWNSTAQTWITVPDTCSVEINVYLWKEGAYIDSEYLDWEVIDCTSADLILEGLDANGTWTTIDLDAWDSYRPSVGESMEFDVRAEGMQDGVNHTLSIRVSNERGDTIWSQDYNFTADQFGESSTIDVDFEVPDTCSLNLQVNLYAIRNDTWDEQLDYTYYHISVDDCTRPIIDLIGAHEDGGLLFEDYEEIEHGETSYFGMLWGFQARTSGLTAGDYRLSIIVQDMWREDLEINSVNFSVSENEAQRWFTLNHTWYTGDECTYYVQAMIQEIETDPQWGENIMSTSGYEGMFSVVGCSPSIVVRQSDEGENGTWHSMDSVLSEIEPGDSIWMELQLNELDDNASYLIEVDFSNASIFTSEREFQEHEISFTASPQNGTSTVNVFQVDAQDACGLSVMIDVFETRENSWGWTEKANLHSFSYTWAINNSSAICPPVDSVPPIVSIAHDLDMVHGATSTSINLYKTLRINDWFRLMFSDDGTINQTIVDELMSEIVDDIESDDGLPFQLLFDGEDVWRNNEGSLQISGNASEWGMIGTWNDGTEWWLTMSAAVDVQTPNGPPDRIEVVFDEGFDMDDGIPPESIMFDVSITSTHNSAMTVTSAIRAGSEEIELENDRINGSWTIYELGSGIRIVFEDPSSTMDSDGDGVIDSQDYCPGTMAGSNVDADGCSATQLDADDDGVMDASDACPTTPENRTNLDADGCSDEERDSDDDGVMDIDDACPTTPLVALGIGDDGCSDDDDGDGWSNTDETACGSISTNGSDVPSDLDGDGYCDDVDFDADNDGWSSANETVCGSNPLNSTAIPLDSDEDGICDAMDPTPYPLSNLWPTCSVAYSIRSTVSFMGTSIETRMDGGNSMSTPLTGAYSIDLPIGEYMIFFECHDPDGDNMNVTISDESGTTDTIALGDSYYAEFNLTLTEEMVGSGSELTLSWDDGTAYGQIQIDFGVIAADLPIDVTPEEASEGGLPGFPALLGVISLLGAAIAQRRRE